jgi:hypothetical protein
MLVFYFLPDNLPTFLPCSVQRAAKIRQFILCREEEVL